MNSDAALRLANLHANDLFLLICNLSQMSNNDKILEIFLRSLQAVYPDLSLSYLSPESVNSGSALKISSGEKDFGFLSFGSSEPGESDLSLMQNACGMLGLILRKNEQSQEKQNSFRILFENMTQGVVYQDAKGNITSANPAAERILGLSLDQMRGRTSMNPEWKAIRENGENLSGEHHPAMVALRTGKPVLNSVQGIYNPEIESQVWMAVDSIPQFLSGSSEPYQVISVFSDITLQRGAQLAESEAISDSVKMLDESIRTRKALLSVVEDLQKTEADLSDTKANLEILNSRLQELVYAVKNLSAARTMEEIQKVTAASAKALLYCDGVTLMLREGDSYRAVGVDPILPLCGGKPFPLESWINGQSILNKQIAVVPDILADAKLPQDLAKDIPFKSLVLVPVNPDDPFAALGYYWSKEFIPTANEIQLLQTLADAAAKAIQNIQLVDNLEKNVKLRTSELEIVVKELESFSYSVSHDLRAPLRVIDGYVQILLEDFSSKLDGEGKRVCGVISDSARKMGRLIDDLLAFSRSGKASMELSPIDMAAMARSVFSEITTENLRNHIDFSLDKMPPAMGDPSLIKQVWLNLIGNAIKFSSKKDRPVIAIRSERKGDEVIFSISDNGAGFDMKYAEKLFGVFQRMHSQDEFEGTGIGLAIVQRIIARHGGKIWASAEPGKGAAFYFTLKHGGEA
ncbi:MAG: ATP-binding protein [Candidatus Shapirobacteria bacterium]|jgi:hypothetical protein